MEYIEKLYRFYLTKKQVDKLTIIRNIILEKQLSLDKICETINKSLYQVKILINEIAEDMREFTTFDESIFLLKKRTVYLSRELSEEQSLHIFVNLKKKYFLESPYYRLLSYLLRKRKTRMVDISEELIFSISYCYKLISYLKKMLVIQNVPITINNNTDSIDLTGAEPCVRMYHYLVEIMACNVYINQRTRASVELAAKEYEPLKTTKVKHDIMFSIIENAVLRGYIVNELDEASIAIYEQIKQLNGEKQVIKLLPIRSQQDIEKEQIFYHFWVFLFIPETISDQEKLLLGKQLRNLSGNPLVEFSADVVAVLSQKYDLSKAIEAFLTYELVMNTWGCLHLFLDSFVSTEDLSSTNERVLEVEELIATVLERHSFVIEKEALFLRKIAQITASYLPIQKEEPIRIGISLLNHPEYIPVIKNKLLKIYNENVIHFSSNLGDSDILVSDGVLIHNESQKFTFFGNVHSTKDWHNLHVMIQSMISNKYT